MNSFSRGKLSAYLAAIFVAGAVSGAVVTARLEKKPSFRGGPRGRGFSVDLQKKFQDRLELTPAQLEKNRPLLEQTARSLESIHRETMQRVDEVLEASQAELRKELSPAQLLKLDEMERERREFMKKTCPPSPRKH